MGTPSTASASLAAACSLMISGGVGPTLGSARTATPAGSALPRGHSTGPRTTPSTAPTGSATGGNWAAMPTGGTHYRLYERRLPKAYATVSADGRCTYNSMACAPDDPRVLALIAQVAPVEVRPAVPAPHPPLARHSPPSNRPMDRPAHFAPAGAGGRLGHRGAPPRRTPSLVSVRHNPTAAALHRTPRSDACARRFAVVVAREAQAHVPSCTLPPSSAPRGRARRRTEHWRARGGLHVSVHTSPPSLPVRSLLGRALQLSHPVSVWQAEEAVANLPLRLAVRLHCGHPSSAWCARGTEEALHGCSQSTRGTL